MKLTYFLIGEGLIIFSYIKKKIVTILIIFGVAFSVVGCTIEKAHSDTYDCIKIVYDYLETQGIRKCQVQKLGKYTKLQYSNNHKDQYGLFNVNNEYYLLKSICEASLFHIDENEILDYSLTIVKRFEELANMKGMSLDEYYQKELNISEDQFYNLCYQMGEGDIKNKLIVGSIASKEGISINKEEISSFCNLNNLSEEDNRYEIYYKALEKKVYTFLESNNTCE